MYNIFPKANILHTEGNDGMKIATTIFQMVVRLTGLIQITLGVLIWTGNGGSLIQSHMLVGMTLVLSLWVVALLGIRAGVPVWLVAAALTWGIITIVFGMTQSRVLPGSFHWVMRVLHLVVGLVAMGLSEQIATRIKRVQPIVVRTRQPTS